MGFWFNNFQEFGKKQKGENKLILNFYYLSPGEQARKVKILLRRNVRVPTKFLFSDKAEKTLQEIAENSELDGMKIKEHNVGKYKVIEAEIPKTKELLDSLPSAFQTGNYDKLLRLGGFFPERKAEFNQELEAKLQEKDEIELESLDGVYDMGQLSINELRNLPWLYIDIEKPLWKHDDEKIYLARREKLLKRLKKDEKAEKKNELSSEKRAEREERINKLVKILEDRLVLDIPDVGQVRLWEKNHDASVSFITTCWKNIGDKEIKEINVLDPKDEFQYREVNGYKVLKFRTERELIEDFLAKVKERKPMAASGHNEVYDITQIRFAADKNKMIFDPAVKNIKPRRDFVREFFQRMKEDLMYFDTLWLNSWFFPWLKQRTFSNLKLEQVSKAHGIDFKKSLTHEQLREVELQRLSGASQETRLSAAKKMAEYAAGDLEPVIQMIENLPFLPLIVKLKKAMPFCTLTQIAFHPNCTSLYHDWKHFQRARNQRYFGYAQKERENEIQIFKKRFPSLKREMLEWAGIKEEHKTSLFKDSKQALFEIYLPFEEWIKDPIFLYAPEFKKAYESLEPKEKLPFSQALKALEREILVDYNFARRDLRTLKETDTNRIQALEKIIEKETLNKYYSSFKFLKNHFRSIYVALNGKGRALIRPLRKNIESLSRQSTLFEEIEEGEEIPGSMINEADMFLLKQRAGTIRGMLSQGQQRVLSAFLTNFSTLEKIEQEVQKTFSSMYGKGLVEPDLPENARELLYFYNQHRKVKEKSNQFYARYRFSIQDLTRTIAQSYKNLAAELKTHNARVREIKGDYLFVQADESIKSSPLVYVVREFPGK